LNADEKKQLDLAKQDGNFTFDEKSLVELSKLPSDEVTRKIVYRYISNPSTQLVTNIEKFLGAPAIRGNKDRSIPTFRLKRAIVSVLQSPEYQLC
jgi:hypothetical protein